MIPQDLLEILVCPVCKKPLTVKENGESLKCAQCRRVYPVRDNIPILLIDEAVTDPSRRVRPPGDLIWSFPTMRQPFCFGITNPRRLWA